MANVLHPDEIALLQKHHENVVASLNRRLAVARANCDQTLIALLEQEQQQIVADVDRHAGSLQQQLATLWDDLTTLVRGDANLRVWQTVDRHGEHWWCAYDPKTGQSVYADSESEMRLWIEQNYVAESR